MNEQNEQQKEFDEAAAAERASLLAELVGFMAENKKWWLAPILLTMGLLGLLLVLGGTPAGPFIYTLFDPLHEPIFISMVFADRFRVNDS